MIKKYIKKLKLLENILKNILNDIDCTTIDQGNSPFSICSQNGWLTVAAAHRFLILSPAPKNQLILRTTDIFTIFLINFSSIVEF